MNPDTIHTAKRFSRLFLLTAFWISALTARAQVPTCGPTVPYDLIDFTGNPDSTWISDPTVRQGQCCGTSNPIRCLSYEIILDPNTAGVVMSSNEGALPPGSYYYQIGCGPMHYLDSVICLTGVGPHYITFCKPGGNTNIYQIKSIAKPTFPGDDSTRVGCFKRITTYGLDTSTVTWNSVYPGAPGAWNHFLSATTNATSVVFTPDATAPTYIDYQICGQPTADECGYILYTCDTVRMYVFPALTVTISPNPAGYCASSGGVWLYANPSGGNASYTYAWENPLGGAEGSADSVFADMPGLWEVTINDGLSGPTCGGINHSISVQITADPTVDAGPAQTICPSGAVAVLNGTITNAPGAAWTSSGTGTFSPSVTTIDATYNPSLADAGMGSVWLYLTTLSTSCPNATDSVQISFGNVLAANITPATLLCYGDSAVLTASVTSGNGSYTYLWSTGATTASISVPAGTWCVTVTDALDCEAVACYNLTQPPVLSVTTSSTDATIPLGVDGTASAFPSGGTGPYIYLWAPGGQTTSSISGLPMGVYVVSVTDANGCTAVASAVVNDPRCAGFTATALGTVLDCYGDQNGYVYVNSVTGGTPPYGYYWQTNPIQINDTAFGLGAGTYTVIVVDAIGCSHQTNATITQPPQMTNSMTQTNNDIIGGTTGTATANPGGGTPGYTYVWSNGQTTITATGLAAGVYYLTATDTKGCTLEDSVMITEPPCNNLSISLLHDNVSCFGGNDGYINTNVTGATPPVLYNWSTGSSASGISGLIAGSYSVTVTDSLNCQNFANHTITQPSDLFLSLIPTHVACYGGNNGSVDISVSGGVPPYSFTWSNGSESEDLILLLPGTYSVTVEDANGCTITGATGITQPLPLALSTVIDSVTCTGGNDGSINLSVSGGQPMYGYLWSTTDATEDLSGLTAGGYVVTVTDGNGCTISKGYIVPEPDTLKVDTAIVGCPAPGGSTASFTVTATGGNGTAYQLSTNGGATWGPTGVLTVSVPVNATYNLQVRDIQGCLSALYPFFVPPVVVIDSITFPVCLAGGTATVTATAFPSGGEGGPYQISWNNGSTWNAAGAYTAILPVGATYLVIARDAAMCQSDTFSIIVPNPFITSVTSVSTFSCGYNISCNGGTNGSINVSTSGGTTPYTYLWSTGAATEDLSGLAAGSYSYTVTDGNGCTATASVTLTQPAVVTASASSPTFSCGYNVSCNGANDGSATVTPGGGCAPFTYMWSNGQTTATATALVSGSYSVTVTDANGCTATSSVTLTQPAVVTASASSPTFSCGYNVSCNGANDGSAAVTPGGGCAPYTYLWSNGQTTATATALVSGSYSVTVTDANGCTATASVTLTQPAVVTASASSPTFSCGYNVSCNGANDGSATVTPGGGCTPYSYLWSNGQTTVTATALVAGPYSVTVTDANGCTATSGVTLTQPAVVTASASSPTFSCGYNVSCNGANDGTATVTPGGGCAPYSYLWSNGQTTVTATALVAGPYSVTVTDANGCTATSGVTLTQPAVVTASASSPTFSCGYNVSCNGANDGSATVTPGGGCAPYTYLWSNGQTTATATSLVVGPYSVTVTDANGCTATSSVTLTEPVVLTASGVMSAYACGYQVSSAGGSDGSVNLTASGGCAPYSYLWSTTATTEDVSGLTAGTYGVTITDANGCTFSTSFILTQPAALTASGIPAVYSCGYNVTCNGTTNGSINLTASGGCAPYTFLWSTSATTEDISGLGAGSYSVTVTDANLITYSTSFTLTEPAVLTASGVSALYSCGYNVSCNGAANGSINLTPSGGCAPYSYLWSTSATTEDVSSLSAGGYSVTVTDANGCTYSTSFTLTEPALLTAAGVPAVYSCGYNVSCNGAANGSINLTPSGGCAPYSYLWNTSATTEDVSSLSAGGYSVTVTDANGCTYATSFTLTEPALLTASGVSAVYSCGYNVSCNGATNGSINLTPSGGCGPYSYLWSTSATTEDVSSLSAGGYSVTVTDANGCTYATSFTLTEPALLAASGVSAVYSCGYNVSCNGATNGSINLTPSGGCAPYSYLWSTSATTEDVSSLSAGGYSVTVTDANGCTYATNFTLTEPALLTASGVSAVYSCGYNVSCNGSADGSIDLTPSGGCAPYSYLWSTSATSEDVSGLSAGGYSVTVTDANGCTYATNFTLTEPALLTASGIAAVYSCGYNVSCNGATNGSINLMPSGGCAPYSYLWSTSATTEDVSALSAGGYSVTVTDANGCTYATSFMLTEPALLTASGIAAVYSCGYNVSCNGSADGSIDLTPSGGCAPYSYIWSTSATTEDLSGLAAGGYNVTVTDANGCAFSLGFVLTEPAAVTANIVPGLYAGGWNISCNGAGDGNIDLTPAGGCGPYTYLWSDGYTGEDPSSLSAGTYSVQVTDSNGCMATDTVTLTEPAPLVATLVPLIYNGGWNISCNGLANGFVDLTATGGTAPYSFVWSDGSTGEDLLLATTGFYTVTITDANGCLRIDSITLTEPPPVVLSFVPSVYAGGYNISCNGASDGSIDLTVNGGTPGYLYLWSNGSFSEDIGGVGAGTYIVGVTDANACVTADTISLNEPPALNATALITPSGCAGGASGAIDLFVVGGVSPYIYAWSNGATTEDISSVPAGTYDVTITDANGCAILWTGTVTEASPIALVMDITPSTCFGFSDGSINLIVSGGTSPYTFAWSNGATTEDITGLAPGSYAVLVIDANSCTDTLTGWVTEPDPIVVNAGLDLTTCEAEALLAGSSPDPGQSGLWSLFSGSGFVAFPADSITTVTGLGSGTNSFVWTIYDGPCSASDTITVTHEECGPYILEMPTAYSPNSDGRNDYFVVKNIEHFPDNVLTVFNRWGDQLYTRTGYMNDWHGQSGAGDQAPDGTYFVILTVNGGEITLHSYVDLRR